MNENNWFNLFKVRGTRILTWYTFLQVQDYVKIQVQIEHLPLCRSNGCFWLELLIPFIDTLIKGQFLTRLFNFIILLCSLLDPMISLWTLVSLSSFCITCLIRSFPCPPCCIPSSLCAPSLIRSSLSATFLILLSLFINLFYNNNYANKALMIIIVFNIISLLSACFCIVGHYGLLGFVSRYWSFIFIFQISKMDLFSLLFWTLSFTINQGSNKI